MTNAAAPAKLPNTSYLTPGKTYPHLTPGKTYDAYNVTDTSFNIVDDDGEEIFCRPFGCAHISFQDWSFE